MNHRPLLSCSCVVGIGLLTFALASSLRAEQVLYASGFETGTLAENSLSTTTSGSSTVGFATPPVPLAGSTRSLRVVNATDVSSNWHPNVGFSFPSQSSGRVLLSFDLMRSEGSGDSNFYVDMFGGSSNRRLRVGFGDGTIWSGKSGAPRQVIASEIPNNQWIRVNVSVLAEAGESTIDIHVRNLTTNEHLARVTDAQAWGASGYVNNARFFADRKAAEVFFLDNVSVQTQVTAVPNAGFEGGFTTSGSNSLAPGWRRFQIDGIAQYTITGSSDVVRSGTGAQKIELTRAANGHARLTTAITHGIVKGRYYEGSVWVKSRRATGFVELLVHNNRAWFPDDLISRSARIGREWEQVVLRFRADETIPNAQFSIKLSGENAIWVDDASFRELRPSDVPPAPPTGVNFVRNGSFETDTANWVRWAATFSSVVEANAPQGSRVASINWNGSNQARIQSHGMALPWGHSYTLAFNLRTLGGAGNTTIVRVRSRSQTLAEFHAIASGTAWETHAFTFELPPSPTEVVYLEVVPPFTNTIRLDAVQLMAGSQPTPFVPRGPVELGISMSEPTRIYTLNQSASGTLILHNHGATATSLSLRRRVIDIWGEVVLGTESTWNQNLPPGRSEIPITFFTNPQLRGAFRIEVDVATANEPSTAYAEALFTVIDAGLESLDSPLGTVLDFAPSLNDRYRKGGYGWTKTWALNWRTAQPTAGSPLVFTADQNTLVNNWTNLGIKPLGILSNPPKWAQPESAAEWTWGWTTPLPEHRPQMSAYAKAAVEHYGAQVPVWELQNEPTQDLRGLNEVGIGRTQAVATAYAIEARALMDGALEADPHVKLLFGSSENRVDIPSFLDLALQEDPAFRAISPVTGRPNLHGVSYHYYTGDTRIIRRLADETKAVLASHGLESLKIWDTEWAPFNNTQSLKREELHSATFGSPTAAEGAALLIKGHVARFGEGLEGSIFYDTYNPGRMDVFNHKTMLELDGSVRPTYAANAFLAQQLTGITHPSRLSINGGFGYRFVRADGRALAVVWLDPEAVGPQTFTAPFAATRYDTMGNSRGPVAAGASLILTDEPIYLVGPVVTEIGLGAHFEFESVTNLAQSTIAPAKWQGTVHGGVTRDTTQKATGSASARFEGNGDHLWINDAPGLDDTDRLTLALWARPDGLTDANQVARGLLSKRITANNGVAFSIFQWTNNRIFIDLDAGTSTPNRIDTGYVLQNRWQHLAVVFDGTLPSSQRIRLYVDNQLVGTWPHATSSIRRFADSTLHIGALNTGVTSGGGPASFKGWIDDVRIYHGQAIDPVQRRAVYEPAAADVFSLPTFSNPIGGGVTLYAGQPATLSISVSGGFPIPTLRWQKAVGASWVDIPGATSTALHLPAVTGSGATLYRIVATNALGDSASAPIVVNVVADEVLAGLQGAAVGTGTVFVSREVDGAFVQTTDAVGLDGDGDGADGIIFDYRSVSGPFQALVNLRSLSGGATARAGLMLREEGGIGSRFVTLSASSGSGWEVITRPVANGPAAAESLAAGADYPDRWLLIKRQGALLQLAESTDAGQTFTVIAYRAMPELSETVQIGIFTSSGSSALAHATFVDWELVSVHPSPTGSVDREWWTEINGSKISHLINNARYPNSPDGLDQLKKLDAIDWDFATSGKVYNWANYYGQRIRGYLIPPATGEYTFWIAGDDECAFWLSDSQDPAGKKLRAHVPGYSGYYQWTKYASQQSAPVTLEAGKVYYLEILHKEGGGGDYVRVAWNQPGEPVQAPASNASGDALIIPGSALSSYYAGVPSLLFQDATALYRFEDPSVPGAEYRGLYGGTAHSSIPGGIAIDPTEAVNGSGALRILGNGHNHITVPDHDAFDDTQQLSISLWVKTASAPDQAARGLISKRIAYLNQQAYSLMLWQDGGYVFDLDNGAGGVHRHTTNYYPDDQWHLVTVTFDGNRPANERVNISINQNLIYSGFHPASHIANKASPLYIGSLNANYFSGGGPASFNGWIDDVSFFRRALLPEEIEALFTGGLGDW